MRDNFSLCIATWANAYKDDSYLHHLMYFCNSVYRQNIIKIAPVRNNSSQEVQEWYYQSSLHSQSPPSSSTYHNSNVTIDHIIELHSSGRKFFPHLHHSAYAPNSFTQQRGNGDDYLQSVPLNDSTIDIIRWSSASIINPFLAHSELHVSASPSLNDGSSSLSRNNSYNMIFKSSKSVPTNKGKNKLVYVPTMSRYKVS